MKQRIDRPELMDTLPLSPEQTKQTLAFLQRTNAYFGGIRVVLNQLNAWTSRWTDGKTISILDIGTGAGDIPLALHNWAREKNIPVEITGIDIMPNIVDIAIKNTAHIPAIKIEQVNAETLAWTGKQYDVVMGSLFLHHVPLEKQAQMLGIFDQLAKRAVLVSDLFRSLPSYIAVSAAASLLGNGIVRHDGPLSVRRAFTVEELNELARQAGLPYLRARREPWCRVSLSGEKPHAA